MYRSAGTRRSCFAVIGACMALVATLPLAMPQAMAKEKSPVATQCGKASWYAMTSKTASGERASPYTMTAAHRTLPFGTVVTVTNKANGKSVDVRINDRGPFVKGRVIDLTKAAADKIGFLNAGVANVKLTVKGKGANKLSGYNCADS
ncbi:septal ring lytic transglycosylase RlpA family protein [Pseudovibrio flavus]|uniref:septal ring lytic transglycosylase RlpA family protein n=1 Tax=Pseudovibrio flavus TaxID=2529854 RepID=UPI003528362C